MRWWWIMPFLLVLAACEEDNFIFIKPVVNDTSAYGELWIRNETAPVSIMVNVTDAYFNVTGFRNGSLKNFSVAKNSTLTVGIGGLYRLDYGVSFSGGGNSNYGMGVFKNGVLQQNTYLHRKMGAAGDVGNAGTTALIRCNVGDNLTLNVEDEASPAQSISVWTANINMVRVGD